jgi:hypothetical protein
MTLNDARNVALAAILGLIKAKQDWEQAVPKLVRAHGGKRCEPLMDDLVCLLRTAFPGCKAATRQRADGQWLVSFPTGETQIGRQFYKDNIAPLLPKLRDNSKQQHRVDPVDAAIKKISALLADLTPAQRRAVRKFI